MNSHSHISNENLIFPNDTGIVKTGPYTVHLKEKTFRRLKKFPANHKNITHELIINKGWDEFDAENFPPNVYRLKLLNGVNRNIFCKLSHIQLIAIDETMDNLAIDKVFEHCISAHITISLKYNIDRIKELVEQYPFDSIEVCKETNLGAAQQLDQIESITAVIIRSDTDRSVVAAIANNSNIALFAIDESDTSKDWFNILPNNKIYYINKKFTSKDFQQTREESKNSADNLKILVAEIVDDEISISDTESLPSAEDKEVDGYISDSNEKGRYYFEFESADNNRGHEYEDMDIDDQPTNNTLPQTPLLKRKAEEQITPQSNEKKQKTENSPSVSSTHGTFFEARTITPSYSSSSASTKPPAFPRKNLEERIASAESAIHQKKFLEAFYYIHKAHNIVALDPAKYPNGIYQIKHLSLKAVQLLNNTNSALVTKEDYKNMTDSTTVNEWLNIMICTAMEIIPDLITANQLELIESTYRELHRSNNTAFRKY